MLRKITLLILILKGSVIALSAQTDAFKPTLGVGFHGGWVNSSVSFEQGIRETGIRYRGSTGNSYGLMISYMGEKNAGIQVEASMLNAAWQEVRDSAYVYTRKEQYYQFPLLTHLNFKISKIRLIFNLGPYIAFNQIYSEEFQLYDGVTEIPRPDTNNVFGQPVDNKTDLGFIFDGGVGVETSIGVFQIKARYSLGIVNMYNKYPKGVYRFSQWRSFYLGAAYYYYFTLK
jgi:hypothetical protein